jgi:outer membrane immunogenic protein
MAADMPVKAPPPPPVALYDWSGIYMGFHAGYLWADTDWSFYTTPATFISPSAEHWMFGGHGGAQVQFGAIVIGVEAALSVPGKENTESFVVCPIVVTDSCGIRAIYDLGTIGGKLGFAFDRWLLAVHGGYAWGTIQTTSFDIAGDVVDRTQSHHDGWYVGASLEYMLHKGSLVDVIAGVEYQYIQLDSAQHNPLATTCIVGAGFCRDVEADISQIRARLTIKTHGWDIFYEAPAAVQARN